MSEDMACRVELGDLIGLYGIIVNLPTSVVFSNQCGGVRCEHPELEGVFIPFPHHKGDVKELRTTEELWMSYPQGYDIEFVDFLLQRLGLHPILTAITLEDQFLLPITGWGEAWIPVKVSGDHDELFSNLYGHYGVLVYQNSD